MERAGGRSGRRCGPQVNVRFLCARVSHLLGLLRSDFSFPPTLSGFDVCAFSWRKDRVGEDDDEGVGGG